MDVSLSSSDRIAIASAVVAGLAFIATAWQAALARKHNRLSVKPLITSHVHTKHGEHGSEITFEIQNVGIGPAIITDRYFTLESERIELRDSDDLEEICHRLFGQNHLFEVVDRGLPGKNTALPPGKSMTILVVKFLGLGKLEKAKLWERTRGADFHICYQCLYERTYHFCTSDQLAARPS